MYRHCPACTRDLGRNEALEHFPVGKRLAFDVERGRLWALCPRCRSWNLAPIEERWEAVEEAERRFEHAEEGLATEHITLGKLRDGTELVRIGKARAPELAGWRYAQRIQDRYRRARWVGGIGTAGWFLWATGGYSLVAPVLPFMVALGVGVEAWRWQERRGHRLDIFPEQPAGGGAGGADPDGAPGRTAREALPPEPRARTLGRRDLRHLRLLPPEPDTTGAAGSEAGWRLLYRRFGSEALWVPPELRNRALRYAMLELNQEVGKPDQVKKALDRVVQAGGADALISAAARTLVEGRAWESEMGWPFGDPRFLKGADAVMRLAIEIAANDEAERVALEGELHRLTLEWQEAEAQAAIADDLLVPPWIRRRIETWRRSTPPPIAPPPAILDSEAGGSFTGAASPSSVEDPETGFPGPIPTRPSSETSRRRARHDDP